MTMNLKAPSSGLNDIELQLMELEAKEPNIIERVLYPVLKKAADHYPGKAATAQYIKFITDDIDGMEPGPEKQREQAVFVRALFDALKNNLEPGSKGAAYFLDDREVGRIASEVPLRKRSARTYGGHSMQLETARIRAQSFAAYFMGSTLTLAGCAAVLPATTKAIAAPAPVEMVDPNTGASQTVTLPLSDRIGTELLTLAGILASVLISSYTWDEALDGKADEMMLQLVPAMDAKLRKKVREISTGGRDMR
jgi:hypothetical protein